MTEWQLKDCYILEDMERLDNPEYFQKDFTCPQLRSFFQQITDQFHIIKNRKAINDFFEKLLSFSSKQKTLYVRLKWLIYFHSQIKFFGNNMMMYTYTTKALHLYLDKLCLINKKLGPFEQYLSNLLLKPYLQYLVKFCILNNGNQQEDKENRNSGNIEKEKQQWYRNYNLVHWALQNFGKSFAQVRNFFAQKFPFLNKIAPQVYSDLKESIKILKRKYSKIQNLQISLIQLEKLQEKITLLYQEELFFITQDYQFISSQVKDYSTEDVKNFFMTPAKQIKQTSYSYVQSPSEKEVFEQKNIFNSPSKCK